MVKGKKKILLVEDEKDLVRLIRYNLEREQYSVLSAADGESGLTLTRRSKPHLVILDIMLPKMSGLDCLKRIREESRVPVILLTVKRSEPDRILGLKLGADDYVVKPFSVGELQARVEALLRRSDGNGREAAENAVSIGGLEVDFERHEVKVKGKAASLTPKEFELLRLLVEANGKVLSRDQLLERIWGHGKDIEIDTRTVDQHVARLRHKLKADAFRIATVTNFGYQFKR
ncbi:MAG: response regulator transcription factor [Elusimicrobia bacterium]|nr:response regulator transcription factor [Elusimicrobiota bacterium]